MPDDGEDGPGDGAPGPQRADAAGQPAEPFADSLAGPSSDTYTYDEAGRLTSWNNGTATTAYGYDGNGNLTRDGARTYTYDARDELTSDGTASYTYTARGTPSSESGLSGSIAVSFDAYGDQATAGTRSYAYDALGRLTADTATSSGTGYQFSYAGPTGTIASDGASTYTWDPSGSVLAGVGAAGGGSGVLALTSAHGDVLGQFTASGSAVSGSQSYDPWGKVTATTGTQEGLLGFQSAWSDPASGKDLMGARWYAPGSGDFTSADTVQVSPDPDPAAGNPFAYAGDEPLDVTDPSGHGCGWTSPLSCVKAVVNKVKSSPVVKKAVSLVKAVVKKAAPVLRVARAAVRTTRNIAAKVADGAKTVVRATAFAVTHPVAAAKAVARAVKALPVVKKAVSALKTAGTALKAVVQKSAVSAGRFVKAHEAEVGGTVAGIAVYAGCEYLVRGDDAGEGCAAASGAAASAVSYGITAAQRGGFSWKGLGEAAATGADSGLVTSEVGVLFDSVAGSFASDASSELTGTASGEARPPAEEEPAPSQDDGGGSSCPAVPGGNSFTAATGVLLASGKTVPISQLKVGDKVLAADTRTGKDQPETVTAVLVHHDTDLYNLTVKTSTGTEVIHTTSNHLFWDPYPHYGWIPANHLKPGMHLKTQDGKSAVVVSGSVPAVHDGWMWDLTVQDDHDFYVEPAVVLPPSRAGPSDVAVLVHNCGEYNNFYGGSEGGVMATLDKGGVLSLAIEKGPTTPNGGQMFTDAVNNFGADNINGIAGKWVRAMPSNLNTFNDLVRSGMGPEEAAASTFTGKMAARFGFTDVSITSLSGEPGAYTDVQALFTRPAG